MYAIRSYYDGIGADSGAAYLYQNNSGVWSQVQKLVPADLAAGDQFGISVSISGDYAIVGENYDADFGNRSGSAYIYYNNAGSWEENLKINAPDANEYDEFVITSYSIHYTKLYETCYNQNRNRRKQSM